MIDQIPDWITTILIAFIGFFIRDIYNFLKKKIVKGRKPKMSIEYNYQHSLTSGTNPRNYTFRSTLIIQNIDTEPLYNLKLSFLDNPQEEILKLNLLSPTEKKEVTKEKVVSFGNQGNDYNGAKELLDQRFKAPKLILKYENKDGHNFKEYLNRK